MAELRKKFWETIPLEKLTAPEWEALCDGCGKCCLVKLEDWDTQEIAYTNVACRLLDCATCRCSQYEIRKSLVDSCVVITPDNLADAAYWMPTTCAYRLLFDGKPLPEWHPLITGDANSPKKAGISMVDRCIPEYEIDEEDWEDYIVKDLQ